MITNQIAALIDAHVQPSRSSSPKRTRRRPVLPALIACPAIVLHPRRDPVPGRGGAYLTVRSPIMFGCHLQLNL